MQEVAPWFMALVCLLAIAVAICKWRISRRVEALLTIPSLLWLGFIYFASWQRWFDWNDPMIRAAAVRLAVLMLLLSKIIADVVSIKSIKFAKWMLHGITI